MLNEFITIKENVQTQIVEKKSKFIANLFYIENPKQAEESIKAIKKQYFDAKHNCVAYRVINETGQIIEKSNDDGEPSGTAGSPMLSILQKNNLINVLVIVTRYFGGILLGTGGLVRAYSESTLSAIQKATKIEKHLGEIYEITLNYSEFDNFRYYCKKNQININNVEYKEDIVCRIEIEENKKDRFIREYKTKKLNIKNLQYLSKKYIDKSKSNNSFYE